MDQYDQQQEPQTVTLLSLGQLPWMAAWMKGVQTKLGEGFTADVDKGLLISEDVPEDAVQRAVSYFADTKEKNMQIIRVMNRFIGDAVLWHSAKNRITWGESIEALGLTDATGKQLATLKKYPKVVQKLPADVLALESLSFSHFEAAISFAGPSEPDKMRAWNDAVCDILRKAAENPQERSRKWVADSIRELQKDFGITPQRPVGIAVLMLRYAQLNYILEHWTEDQFETLGHARQKVLDWRDDTEGELLNRGALEIPDAGNFVVPFMSRQSPAAAPIEAELGEEQEQPALPSTLPLDSDELLPIQ